MATVAVTAVLIGSFQGGEVTVGLMASSTVTYSGDNNATGSWTTTLTPSNDSDDWYTRLEIGANSFDGPVEITWQLQQKTGAGASDWTDVGSAQTTNTVLSGGAESVYASSDGGNTGNNDWSQDVSASGTYRVDVTVNTD